MVQINPIGWIFIPLGCFLFIHSRKYLFWGAIVVLPLLTFELVTFPSFILNLPFFFFFLLILRNILDILMTQRTSLAKTSEKLILLTFLFITILSLSMPTFFAKGTPVHPMIEGYSFSLAMRRWEPLFLRRENITQICYLFFFALSFLALEREIKSIERLKRVIKVSALVSVPVIISGFFNQAIRFLNKSDFWGSLFNHIGIDIYWGVGKKTVGGLPRMYSFAGEPGFTSHYLVFVLGLILIPILLRKNNFLWSKPVNYLLLSIIVLGLIFSTGTTGYLASIFLGASLVWLLTYQLSFRSYLVFLIQKTGLIIGGVLFISLVFYLITDFSFFHYLWVAHANKFLLKVGSGGARLQYARDAFSLFLKHPILGVGWGSNKSPNLLPVLFSNSGLIGGSLFLLFNISLLWKTLRVYKEVGSRTLSILALGLSSTFMAVFASMLVAKALSSLLFPWYWLMLGMMSSLWILSRKSEITHNLLGPS